MAGRNFLMQSLVSLAVLAGVLQPTVARAATTPAFTLTTPAAATFPSTAAGATSAAQNIQLTTTRAVTISSIAIAATVNAHQEFTAGTMTGCTIGASAASGTVCTIPVTFSPYYTGVRQQAMVITDSTGQQYTVGLQGFGDGPQTLLTPTSVNTNSGVSGGAYYSGDGNVATNTTLVRLGLPEGVYIDNSNNIYYADYSTHNIRVIYQSGAALACLIEIEEPTLFGLSAGATSCVGATSAPVAGNIYTIAGDTTPYSTSVTSHATGLANGVLATSFTSATTGTLYNPPGVSVDANGNVFVINYNNYVVRVIYSGGDSVACLIQVENPTLFGLSASATSCAGATSSPQQGFIYTIGGSGSPGVTGDGGKATSATTANMYAIALSREGDIYVSDDSVQAARSARIRVIYAGGAKAAALIAATNPGTTPVYGNIYRIAGMSGTLGSTGDGGIATSAIIAYSKGVTVDAEGDVVFTDYNGASLTAINPGKVRVVYNGGVAMGKLITLENPGVTPVVGYVYSIAGGNSSVASGTAATGNGGLASAATFAAPYGVAVDPAGDVFVADYTDRTIRKIQAADGIIYPYAGASAQQGITNGNALTTARLWDPFGLSFGSSGTLVYGEYGVYRVRNIDITAASTTFATTPPGSTSDAAFYYLTNRGTSAATISAVSASTNFTVLALSGVSGSLYPLECKAGLSLPAGQTCAVAVGFAPTTGGSTLTGTLTITDNSSNNTTNHTASLSGIAALQTQVVLTSSNQSANLGTTITLTATVSVVAGQTIPSGTPNLAGTVTITNTTSGVVVLTAAAIDPTTGVVTATVTGLPAGTTAFKAVFTPATTDYASSSATLSQVVVAPDFTPSTTSLGVAVNTGDSVAIPFTIATVGGYTGTVKASCTGLPVNLSCSTSAVASFYGANNTATVTLYISAFKTSAANAVHGARGAMELAGVFALAGLIFFPRRRRVSALLVAVIGLGLAMGVMGCSSGTSPTGNNAARGTYNVNVVFSDGTVTKDPIAVTVSVLGSPGK